MLGWIFIGLETLSFLTIPSILLRRRARPVACVGWIFAVVTLPGLGLALWLLLGRTHLERKRRKRRQASAQVSQNLASLRDRLDAEADPNLRSPLMLRYIPTDLEDAIFAATSGNEVELLVDGAAVYNAMDEAIRSAQHHVHLSYYIWRTDTVGTHFRDMLCERAREGVEVRALYDAVGSPGVGRSFVKPLVDAGGRSEPFLPLRPWRASSINFRNHRKILIVDGRVAFVGGLNLGEDYTGDWHDFAVRLSGPVVNQLQETFADDWFFASSEDLASDAYFHSWSARPNLSTCSVVSSGPTDRGSPLHDALFAAINEARTRVYIVTPYFVPGPAMISALRVARLRDVDVRLLLPQKADVPLMRRIARSYYPDLLRVGVRIYEYSPAVLHGKLAVFDDALSYIGSANLDTRSFRYNFETSCFVADKQLNERIVTNLRRDFDQSHEVDLDKIESMPWSSRVFDAAAHLLSPLV